MVKPRFTRVRKHRRKKPVNEGDTNVVKHKRKLKPKINSFKCVKIGKNKIVQEVRKRDSLGLVITRKFSVDGGYIEVTEKSGFGELKGFNSITGLYVDEDKRNRGIGTRLMKEVVNHYGGKLTGQVSNIFAVKINYKFGFRPAIFENGKFNILKDATLEETEKIFRDKLEGAGSILMILD